MSRSGLSREFGQMLLPERVDRQQIALLLDVPESPAIA
jgi:hypothetical protein